MDQSNKTTDEAPKVVSLFARKQTTDLSGSTSESSEPKEKADVAFDDAMRKNMDNAERLRKERLKANQGVLKSYRIKN